MTLWWWRICRSPTWFGALNPCPTQTTPASIWPTGPGRSPGSAGASATRAGVSSSRFCAPKRKMLGVSALRSTPGTPRMAARTVGTQRPRIASRKRCSAAKHAGMDRPRPMNTPHATSYGLDWPFTRKPREKKPAAFQPSEKSPTQRHTSKPLNTVASSRTSRRDGLACIARKARRFRLGWTQNVW